MSKQTISVQRQVAGPRGRRCGRLIVDKIALHAVEDLDLSLGGVPGVGKGLGHAVVGDGDGRVAPGDGLLMTAAVTSVRASMLDMWVCRCSSTRFSSARSFRAGGASASAMAKGASSRSPLYSPSLPSTVTYMPFLIPSRMGLAARFSINLDTVTELVLSVIWKRITQALRFFSSLWSTANTLPETVTRRRSRRTSRMGITLLRMDFP